MPAKIDKKYITAYSNYKFILSLWYNISILLKIVKIPSFHFHIFYHFIIFIDKL